MSYPVAAVSPKGGFNYMSSGQTYIQKVVSYSPYAYWPLDEDAGASAAVCQIDTGQNGTPANVTFGSTTSPDGYNAPLFNGTSSTIDIDTATLVSNFDGTEGSVICFMKVFNVGVWTDVTGRDIFDLRVNAANSIRIKRSTTNNRMTLTYEAANEIDSNNYSSLSSTGWIHFAMTWSDSGNAAIFYMDGANKVVAAADSTFAGSLVTASIGSKELVSSWWYGYISHMALFPDVKSDADILDLATV